MRGNECTLRRLGCRKIPIARYAGMMFAALPCVPYAGCCFKLLVIWWKPLNDEKKTLCGGPSMMPSVSYLRNADEIGVMCAIADDCMVCGRQAAVFCGRCSVDASGTWSLAADGSSLSALRAPSRIPVQNHREMHDEWRERRALRRCRGRTQDKCAI